MSITAREYRAAALAHFMSDGALRSSGIDLGSDEQVIKLQGQIVGATLAFEKVMNSRRPPKSRDEAIRRAVGLLGMMLAAMFPQYALAIKVAGFLWDVFHQGT